MAPTDDPTAAPRREASGRRNPAQRLRDLLGPDDLEILSRHLAARTPPRPRGRTIVLDVPDGADLADYLAAIGQALWRGEVTPREAKTMTRVVESAMRLSPRRAPDLHLACKSLRSRRGPASDLHPAAGTPRPAFSLHFGADAGVRKQDGKGRGR